MLQEVTRPMRDAERRLLQIRSAPKSGNAYWMIDERRAALVTISISAVFVLVGMLVRSPIMGAVIAGAFVLIRLGGYRERRRLRLHVLEHRQKLVEELEAGEVYTIICQPIRVLEREEFEDEGALWIFDGGEGRYLAICGQDYYATTRFPSSHFEVVMGTRHRIVIGIRSRGLRIPSTLVVKGDEIAWESFPDQNITMFSAPPNAELPVIIRSLETSRAA